MYRVIFRHFFNTFGLFGSGSGDILGVAVDFADAIWKGAQLAWAEKRNLIGPGETSVGEHREAAREVVAYLRGCRFHFLKSVSELGNGARESKAEVGALVALAKRLCASAEAEGAEGTGTRRLKGQLQRKVLALSNGEGVVAVVGGGERRRPL